MNIHKIEKQYLLGDVFSPDALSLARAIYNTYIKEDKSLYMEIRLDKIESLLKIPSYFDTVLYITEVLEEINEPIGVRDFKYFTKVYPMRFLVFCSYEIGEETIEIYLSEEFLHAEEFYMIDNFLR